MPSARSFATVPGCGGFPISSELVAADAISNLSKTPD
jgi:hypothetical protein